jgi:hypothetical protein
MDYVLEQGNGALLHLAVALVPSLGKVIDIVDEALTAPNGHHIAALKVLRHIVGNLTEVKAGVARADL